MTYGDIKQEGTSTVSCIDSYCTRKYVCKGVYCIYRLVLLRCLSVRLQIVTQDAVFGERGMVDGSVLEARSIIKKDNTLL